MQFQCFIFHCAYINRVHAGIEHYVLDIRSLRFATDKILWRRIATAAAVMFFFASRFLRRAYVQCMCSLCSRVIIMSMWIGWWPMCDCVSCRCGKCTYTHFKKNAIEIKSSLRSFARSFSHLITRIDEEEGKFDQTWHANSSNNKPKGKYCGAHTKSMP